jgi:hypothetical protein
MHGGVGVKLHLRGTGGGGGEASEGTLAQRKHFYGVHTPGPPRLHPTDP